jgi:hypothetical protein
MIKMLLRSSLQLDVVVSRGSHHHKESQSAVMPHLRHTEDMRSLTPEEKELKSRADLMEPQEMRQQHEQSSVMDVDDPPDVNVSPKPSLIRWQIIGSFHNDECLFCGSYHSELSILSEEEEGGGREGGRR